MMDIAAASWWEILLRLILALVLGGLIGLERETVEKPAGLRTHTLVTLGAATIWRSGVNVQGLPTAATLWTSAAIGTAAGAGFYLGAAAATALVVIVLLPFKALERRLPRRGRGPTQVLLVREAGPVG